MESAPMPIQRRAPFTSVPMTKVRASSTSEIASVIAAVLRIERGVCSDTANMMTMVAGSSASW